MITNTHPDTERVLNDVRTERERQVTKGWTREHDDRHNTHGLVRLAETRAHSAGEVGPGYYDRRRLIEAVAMLVAAVEAMDRREGAR